MNKKTAYFLSFVTLLLGSFIVIFAVTPVLANHCNACQTEEPVWCYDPETDTDYICDHWCSGNPCTVCTPNDRCEFVDYGSNFCCNSVPPSQTTSERKGNNVCNYEYWKYCNSAGTACDQGPYAYTLNSVTHSCTDLLSCGVCYAGATQTETRYNRSCISNLCSDNYTCARYVIVQERSKSCKSDCSGWNDWSSWYNTGEESSECADDGSCGNKNSEGSACYIAPGCTESQCSAWSNSGGCGAGGCTSTQKPQTRTCPGGSTCYTSKCNPDSSCGATPAPSSSPPPGGTSTLYASPNPVNPNANITVTATSTTACTYTGVTSGGGFANEQSFSCCGGAGANPTGDGKPYWWKWVYIAGNPGNYTASFNGTGSGCSASRAYTVQSITPSNLSVTGVPSCSINPYSVILNWTNTYSTLWADISTNNFASYSSKDVGNQTSTAAPTGFSAGLTLNPINPGGAPYQWRLWNSFEHISGPNFSALLCAPSAPGGLTASCGGFGNIATLNWSAPPGATYYNLTVPGFAGSPFNNLPGTSKTLDTTPGNTYPWSVSACNSAGCSDSTAADTPFTCALPACPGGLGACGDFLPSPASIGTCSNGTWVHNAGTALGYNIWCEKNANPTRGFCYRCDTTVSPWIQATGDVHSNESINAPGGP